MRLIIPDRWRGDRKKLSIDLTPGNFNQLIALKQQTHISVSKLINLIIEQSPDLDLNFETVNRPLNTDAPLKKVSLDLTQDNLDKLTRLKTDYRVPVGRAINLILIEAFSPDFAVEYQN